MATFNWSTINSGDTISFNPATDTLRFDLSDVYQGYYQSAANQVSVNQLDDRVEISFGGKTFALMNVQLADLANTSFVFDDGSQFMVGDQTTGTANDGAGNTITGTAQSDVAHGQPRRRQQCRLRQ
jgi:hypothetical protein